ncbi:MAG: glycosyltransferase family 39 protein [Desulfobacterota bacterium]|nr:glycosyltransferase family 39 protein [Thermodesulfobacteriota bacterium]
MKRYIPFVCLIVILTIGCVVRIWNISQSFWWDELWSTIPYATAKHFWTTISSLGYYFNNHLLYSILCRLSIFIFGESEIPARLPALFFGLACIAAMYCSGKIFFNKQIGLVAAYLLAIAPMHIDHSTEARGYTLLAFFSLLSSLFFLLALKRKDQTFWLFFCIASFLGFYSHAFMLMTFITQCITITIIYMVKPFRLRTNIITKDVHAYLLATFITSLAVLIAYAPIIIPFFENLKKVKNAPTYPWGFIYDLLISFFPGISYFPATVFYAAIVTVALLSLARTDFLICMYAIILLIVPPLLYVGSKPGFAFERYFIFSLPVSLLILGYGIVQVSNLVCQKTLKKFAFGMLLLLATFFALQPIKLVLAQPRQNYREAIKYVEEKVRHYQEGIVLVAIGYAGEHFQYYASMPIYHPKKFDEFLTIASHAQRLWCLITGWLPDMQRLYDNPELFSEDPEQERIYRYVKSSFSLEKTFHGRIPTYIYSTSHSTDHSIK